MLLSGSDPYVYFVLAKSVKCPIACTLGVIGMGPQSEVELLLPQLSKTPTGIPGLDEILLGGLPGGRPTLICGYAGCGKTLLGMTFLVNGATMFDEPGVFVSFEETQPGSGGERGLAGV
jgi:hypothetical protein